MGKDKISKGLIRIGFRREEFKDLIRICRMAARFAEEQGLGDLEDKAETWKRNFETMLSVNKEKE